jgi:hypothetical protein
MKALTLLILLIGFGTTGFSQTEVTWKDLKFKSTKKVWNEEFQAYYEIPRFAKKAKKLDSTKIIITGHFVPVDILSKYYILSASEFHSFCGNINQYDELIAVKIELDSNIRTNDVITLTGTLALNTDDILQLNYILEDAKIVVQEPIKITWEDLKFESTEEVWNEEFQSIYLVPNFTDKAKELENLEIKITGYVLPIDVESGYYILSNGNTHNSCFPVANADEAIDLTFKPESPLKDNQEYTFIGVLKLNREDLLQLNYILLDIKITDK